MKQGPDTSAQGSGRDHEHSGVTGEVSSVLQVASAVGFNCAALEEKYLWRVSANLCQWTD